MNSFFDDIEIPNEEAVVSLLNGTVPINSSAQIINEGHINAINDVKMDTGSLNNTGDIYTGAQFEENNIEIGDVVNINTLENGAELAKNSGDIVIKTAGDFINEGNIVADGGTNVDAGNIDIRPGQNAILKTGSLISASGKGENSNAGSAIVFAGLDSFLEEGSSINAIGGNISGDGGFVELSANRNVSIAGGLNAYAKNGTSGSVLIDPTYVDGSVFIVGDYWSNGADFTITGTSSIDVQGTISTRSIAGGYTPAEHATDVSIADSGTLIFNAPNIYFRGTSQIYTFSNNGYSGGNFTSNSTNTYSYTGAQIHSTDLTLNVSSYLAIDGGTFITEGALKIDEGNLATSSILFRPTSINANSLHVDNFFQQNQPLDIVITAYNRDMYIGNLSNISINGANYNPSTITLQSGIQEDDFIALSGNIATTGDIKLIANDFNIDTGGTYTATNAIFNRKGQNVDIGDASSLTQAELERFDADFIFGDHGANTATSVNFLTSFITTKNITAKADSVYVATGATVESTGANTTISLTDGNINLDAGTIEAPNVIINPDNGVTKYTLDINGTTINAHNSLTLNYGNTADGYRITFIPANITLDTANLTSDFIVPGGDFNISAWRYIHDIDLGNLSNISINGSPFVPSNITLQSGDHSSDYISLSGNIETSGNIKLITYNPNIDLGGSYTAANAIFNRRDLGVEIGDATSLTPVELASFTLSDSYIFGDHGANTSPSVNFYDNFTTANNIYAKADTVYVATGATVQSTGANTTISLTDGNINLDAGTIEAPNVIINPDNGVTKYTLDINGTTINAHNSLTLNYGNTADGYRIIFIPANITLDTANLTSDFIVPGGDFNISAWRYVHDIDLGNLSNISINGSPFIPSNITLQSGDHSSDYISLSGNIQTSGNIKLITYNPNIDLGGSYTAANAIFNRIDLGVEIGDARTLTPAELASFTLSDSYIFGDHGANTSPSVNFYDNFTTANNIYAKADSVYVATGATVKSTGANTTVSLTDGNIDFNAGTIEAPNVIIDPDNGVTKYLLDINGTTINAHNSLTLNYGQTANGERMVFIPNSITLDTANLTSDFIVQGGDFNILLTTYDRDLYIGNLSNISIDGSPFVPSNIFLQSGIRENDIVYVYGNIATSGDIKFNSYYYGIDPGASITADNAIFTARGSSVNIGDSQHLTPTELSQFTLSDSYIFGDHGANTANAVNFYNTFTTANNIYAKADTVYVANAATVQSTGVNTTISLTDGNINFDLGTIEAPNVIINPDNGVTKYLLDIEGTTINAHNSLTLNYGQTANGERIVFIPNSITLDTANLTSDFIVQGGDFNISLTAYDRDLYIGNLSDISINGSDFIPSNITLQSGTRDNDIIFLSGNIEASGNIKLIAYDFNIDTGGSYTATNAIFNRKGLNVDIGNTSTLTPAELERFNADFIFGDHGANTATAVNFYNTFTTVSNVIAGASQINVQLGATLTAGNITFITDTFNINTDPSTSVNATNNVILSRRTAGNIVISDAGFITTQGINKLNGNIIIGNHDDTNELTEQVSINSNVYTDGNNIIFNNNDKITLNNNIIISSRDLNDVFSDNHETALSQGDSGNVIFNTDGDIEFKENSAIYAFANNGFASGYVESTSIGTTLLSSVIKAENIEINAFGNIEITGDITANNELALTSFLGNITQTDGSLIATNIDVSSIAGSIGASDNYIKVESNNSNIDFSAENNIYLDSLYGNNTYGLKSESGMTYLKLHNSIPEPGASMYAPQPPVTNIITIPQEVVNNTPVTPVIEKVSQPQEVIINTTVTPVIEEVNQPQEVVTSITTTPVIEEVNQPEEVVNNTPMTPVIEEVNQPQEVVANTTTQNTKPPEETDLSQTQNTSIIKNITIINPAINNIRIDSMVQSVLDQAVNAYNNALASGIDTQKAFDAAIDILIDSALSKEEAKKLLEAEIIIDSAYLEILEQYVSTQKVSIAR